MFKPPFVLELDVRQIEIHSHCDGRRQAADHPHRHCGDRTTAIGRKYLPGRVGLNIDGFAGRYIP